MTVTTAAVRRIRALRSDGHSFQTISLLTGVSAGTAWNYAHDVPCAVRRGRRSASESDIAFMRRLCENGCTAAAAGRAAGFSCWTVRKYCGDIISRERKRLMANQRKWRLCPHDNPERSMPVVVTVKFEHRRDPDRDFKKVYAGFYHSGGRDMIDKAYWTITGFGEFNGTGYLPYDGGRALITGWMPGVEPFEEHDDKTTPDSSPR